MSRSEIIDEPSPGDLPPRTWYGWWLAWPKWFRIGCWGALGMVLLHAALAVRIYIGLQEAREIRDLRAAGCIVTYSFDRRPFPSPALSPVCQLVRTGMWGRSCANVELISCYSENPGILARFVRGRFPNVKSLYCSNTEFTSEDLEAISQCRKLRHLTLRNTNVDDRLAETIGQLLHLQAVDVSATLIGDETYRAFVQNRNLQHLKVVNSDVSLETLRTTPVWPHLRPQRNADDTFEGVFGSIRWSNGERSIGFPGWNVCRMDRLSPETGEFQYVAWTDFAGSQRMFWHPKRIRFKDEGLDGTYRFQLTVGDRQFRSIPVEFTVSNGAASTHLVEFVMPCTRTEALTSEDRAGQ